MFFCISYTDTVKCSIFRGSEVTVGVDALSILGLFDREHI